VDEHQLDIRREMMRMLKGILWQCLVLMVWVQLTQAAGENEAMPVIEEATPVIEVEEPTYDFQQVTEGEVVKHDFRVLNRGNAPLEIKSVKPG
jgi:hypothetical protein